jgi:hypothetical protein
MYNGKLVYCLTYASESGGITGNILVEILKYFDETHVFPWLPRGSIPVLMVDGHQSCLDPKFVEYINNEGHRWMVCLRVTYATALWQVGDASEKNGMVKQEWYCEKAKLMVWKNEHSLPCAICPEDVMPILNEISYKAYNNIANNKKALAVLEWYPPSMKLLDHPSLSSKTHTATQVPVFSTNINVMPPLPVLNTDAGYAATVLDRLLRP